MSIITADDYAQMKFFEEMFSGFSNIHLSKRGVACLIVFVVMLLVILVLSALYIITI